MTLQDYIKLADDLPDPDKFTHGNRIMVELTFDQIRTIRNLPDMARTLIEAEEALKKIIDHPFKAIAEGEAHKALSTIQALQEKKNDR